MRRGKPIRQRLAALALLGVPMFGYPLVTLPGGFWGGLPAAFVYLFAVWAGLIAVAAFVAESGK